MLLQTLSVIGTLDIIGNSNNHIMYTMTKSLSTEL